MIIDTEERCNRLGISTDAYRRAEAKLSTDLEYESFPDVLDQDELLALIRWYNLHKQAPELFTWDGLVKA